MKGAVDGDATSAPSYPTAGDPYVSRAHTPEEAQWFLNLAIDVAEANSRGMARGQMRRRTAHEYFILAHIDLYADGVGDAEAARLLDELGDVFRSGRSPRSRVA